MLQTIQKIGPLLDLFTIEHPEWGVSEAAEALGVPRSSAHALMTSLVDTGLLTTSGRGRYRLGWRIVELYETMRAGTNLRSLAAPVLRALNEETGETTNLAVLVRGEVLYLDKFAARHQVSVAGLRVGSRLAPHCCALGKALLAHASDRQLAQALDSAPLRRFTEHTITDRDVLLAELAEVRATGVAHETGEVVPAVACVAAPVRDAYGVVVGAISLSGPEFRVLPKREELDRAVKGAAAQIGRRISEAEGLPVVTPFDDPTRLGTD
ncbi:MAG: IclR family transcriptional regulator [Candidatus Nanopelagicales bacterium]